MSIISALHQQNGSLDELAKLPQSEIMQMAQRKQIAAEMVAPILSRKAELMDSVVRTREASMGAQGKPPTVVEGLMAKNAQAEAPQMHDVGVAQLPIPQRQYAGGGIIAFSEGDYVDSEDQEDEDEYNEYQGLMSQVARNNANRNILREENNGAMPSEEGRPQAKAGVAPSKGHHPYKEMVAKDAERMGNDPHVVTRLLQNETGGLKNPETARSKAGAVGIAQFMPATAKQYGIDPTDPKQSSEAMNKHVHHLMKEYGDPHLVAIAYNWGEGNTNKWLAAGADPRKLPEETRGYVKKFMDNAMAQGGQVQGYAQGGAITADNYNDRMKAAFGYVPELGPTAHHYANGGSVQHFAKGDLVYNNETNEYEPEVEREGLGDKFLRAVGYNEGFKKVASMPGMEKAKQGVAAELAKRNGTSQAPVAQAKPATKPAPAAPASPQISADYGNADDQMLAETRPQAVASQGAPSAPAAQAAPKSEYQEYLDMMKQQMADSKKSRESDKNMALIAAGLGIMGGDSPYAAVNIGKGALHGVNYMSESNKSRAAEELGAMKNIGTLLRYKEIGEAQKEGKNLSSEDRKIAQAERERSNKEKEQATMQANLARWKQGFMAPAEKEATAIEALEPERARAIRADAEAKFLKDENTKRMHKALGLDFSNVPDYSGFTIKKKP
jgi:hypothetical protein